MVRFHWLKKVGAPRLPWTLKYVRVVVRYQLENVIIKRVVLRERMSELNFHLFIQNANYFSSGEQFLRDAAYKYHAIF